MSWGEVKKINSNLNTPLNDGGVKIVKSRQVGTASDNGGSSYLTQKIAISEVDPSKCIVQVSSGYYAMAVRMVSLTKNVLTVISNNHSNYTENFTYEITEFY